MRVINSALSRLLAIVFLISIAVAQTAYADQVDGLYASAYGDHSNPAVVFLHGGPGYNSFSFEASNADALSKRAYYVIVFDQRGSGRSQSAPLSAYNFRNATEDIQKVLDFYKVKNPIVIGHSYGGTLAIKYAQAHPGGYRAILLADAPLNQQAMVKTILDRCEKFYSSAGDLTNFRFIEQLRKTIFRPTGYSMSFELGGFIFAHATNCKLYSPKILSSEAVAIWKSLLASPSANLLSLSPSDPFHGMIENEKWLSLNLVPELHALSKIYAVFGTEDGLFDKAQFSEIKAALPDKQTLFLDNASHNVFIDQRNAFLDFVEFVRLQTE